MYVTDVRQTDVRQKHRLMPPPYGGGCIIIMLMKSLLDLLDCDIFLVHCVPDMR